MSEFCDFLHYHYNPAIKPGDGSKGQPASTPLADSHAAKYLAKRDNLKPRTAAAACLQQFRPHYVAFPRHVQFSEYFKDSS